MMGAPDADCERTYKGDCEKLVECSRFEPGAAPTCQAGWVNGMPSGHCFKKCGSDADCKKNEQCTDEMSPGNKACNGKD
jgi:hypothetical protein